MNYITNEFATSIFNRARQLITDINELFFSEWQQEELPLEVITYKEKIYNVLMEFITKFQSENIQVDSKQYYKRAEEFEIMFRNPNNPSIIDQYSESVMFVVNKNDPNYRHIFEPSEPEQGTERMDNPNESANENTTPVFDNISAPTSPSLNKSKSSKSINPSSPFEKFMQTRESSILDKDEEISVNEDTPFFKNYSISKSEMNDETLKTTLETKMQKAEQTKQEMILKVKEQAEEAIEKVNNIKKRQQEEQEALKLEIDQKLLETERRRQEYLMNKVKPKSPNSEKHADSIIIWKPEFPVGHEYVMHSFTESIKIIENSAQNKPEILELCSICMNCSNYGLQFEQFFDLLNNKNLDTEDRQLSSELTILVCLFTLFYNQNIMKQERLRLSSNYEKLVVNNDQTFYDVEKSIFAIPGLLNEPILLELLYQSFKLLKEQVSHFNNYNMYYEICLSTRLNTLVTLEQLINCLMNKLQYPILPDEKEIKSCLQAKRSKMQWIDEEEELDIFYVKDEFSSYSSALDIIELFFSFQDIFKYIKKEWTFNLMQSLVSEIAEILISPESYCEINEEEFLYIELHSLLIELISCLNTILSNELIAQQYFKNQQLEEEYFLTIKQEYYWIIHNLFNPNILYGKNDYLEFETITFRTPGENIIEREQTSLLCMLPYEIINQNTHDTIRCLKIGLELFRNSYKFDEIISHRELNEIFDKIVNQLPIETLIYTETCTILNELLALNLLPRYECSGFIE